MYINEDAVKSSKRIVYAEVGMGVALIVFMVWGGMVSTEAGEVIVLVNVFLFPIVIPFFILGIKRCLMHTELKKYRDIMKQNSVMSYIEIGKMLGKSADEVSKDFEWLNANNILDDTYVDSKNYKIYFGRSSFAKNKDGNFVQIEPKPLIAHVCKFCCGVTMIEKGKVGICDWCNGPIGEEDDDK